MKNTFKKIASMGCASAVLLGMLSGCGSAQTDNSAGSSDTEDTYRVCYVAPAVADNPAYLKIMDLCEQEAAKYDDIEFSFIDGKSDTSTQITGIESCITNDVDVMIIDPIEGEAVKSYVQEAMDEGMKVISINVNLDTYDVQRVLDQTNIGTLLATEAANFINDKLGGTAKVGLLHNEENTNLKLRENGIRAALEELCPGAEIVAEATADNQTDGMTGAENILQTDSGVQVIVCTNGSAALGAYEGVTGMGIAKDAEDFGIFASDCSDEELELISQGTIYRCTVDLLGGIASATLGVAEDLLHGKEVAISEQMPMVIVNSENIGDYVS